MDREGGSPRRPGITIWQVMLGIAGFAVLVVLMLPMVRSARPAAYRAQCVNNLRMIALALRGYAEEHGSLPPAYTVDAGGRRLHSWRTLILPYMEEGPLYETIDLTRAWDDPVNAEALARPVSWYRCPSAELGSNLTTYVAVVDPTGAFPGPEGRRLEEVTDAQGGTLLATEVPRTGAVPWMKPVDLSLGEFVAEGARGRGAHQNRICNAAFVDGSWWTLRPEATPEVRRALVSVAGGDGAVVEAWRARE
jgi:prepilin-type processing-associated H-X9-DG protein